MGVDTVMNVLHMNSGHGESSYANNSLLQETVIRKAQLVLKHTIKGIAEHDDIFGQCFKIADLGCSSGPNTLLTASNIIDMVHEVLESIGLVRETDVDSFNIPYYSPCEDEVRDVIQNEGSFSLDIVSSFQGNWDALDTDYTNTKASSDLSLHHGKNTAKMVRAVMEPLLVSHFGSSIIDELFENYGKRIAEHLAIEKTRHYNIVISLTKK